MLKIAIFALILSVCSCSKKPEEKVLEAIDVAQSYLTKNECQKAIDLLEEVGRQNDNPVYIQVLASAYACRGNFSELTFIATDFPRINTDADELFPSLSILSSSAETEADSSSYTDLKTALNVLLEADGGDQPSQAARNTFFGDRKAGDIGLQAFYLTVTQLGKYLNFYGNVDEDGEKGLGSANVDEQGATPSTCFVTYSVPAIVTYLQGGSNPGGICNSPGVSDFGHPNLSLQASDLEATKTKMCEGLMLITNLFDIINNITLTSNSTLSSLSTLKTTFNTLKDEIVSNKPELETLLETTSQAECEDIVSVSTEFDKLQLLFAVLFEGSLK